MSFGSLSHKHNRSENDGTYTHTDHNSLYLPRTVAPPHSRADIPLIVVAQATAMFFVAVRTHKPARASVVLALLAGHSCAFPPERQQVDRADVDAQTVVFATGDDF